MTESQQIEAFANELDRLVERFESEYDMTYAAVVGVLHLKMHLLCQAWNEDHDDDPLPSD
jgi:hypothetical protein